MICSLLFNCYGIDIDSFEKKKENCYRVISNNLVMYLYEIHDERYIENCINYSQIIPNAWKFIMNKDNKFITTFKNKYYVLLLENIKILSNVELINQFYKTSYGPLRTSKLSWFNDLVEKSDYFEKYYDFIIGKYKLIDDSITYYFNLLEISIQCLSEYRCYYYDGFIQHFEIDTSNYFNPLNMKIDCLERDFGEFLKYLFFSGFYKRVDLKKILFINKDLYNYELVIARIIYPNYYFNIIDNIMLGNSDEEELLVVVKRLNDFKAYFDTIISYISELYDIKKISI